MKASKKKRRKAFYWKKNWGNGSERIWGSIIFNRFYQYTSKIGAENKTIQSLCMALAFMLHSKRCMIDQCQDTPQATKTTTW